MGLFLPTLKSIGKEEYPLGNVEKRKERFSLCCVGYWNLEESAMVV
jgi:hypothetical protein